MSQINMPELTDYQLRVLTDTAGQEVAIFLLPCPASGDPPEHRKMLETRYDEVKSLLALGLIEDVTNEFRYPIKKELKRTGRRFHVYGLSELGFCMFKDGIPNSIN